MEKTKRDTDKNTMTAKTQSLNVDTALLDNGISKMETETEIAKLLKGDLSLLSKRLDNYKPIAKAHITKLNGIITLDKDNQHDNTLLEIQLMTDNFGDRTMAKNEGVGSHNYITAVRHNNDIGTNRKYSQRYDKGRVRKNYFIHPLNVDKWVDGKGIKDKPQNRGHGYKYVTIGNKVVKIIAITDKQPKRKGYNDTAEFIWIHIDRRNEPKHEILKLLSKAHNSDKMDLTNNIICLDTNTALESKVTKELGITFVAYGKGLNVINCPLLHKMVYEGTTDKDIKKQEIKIKIAWDNFFKMALDCGFTPKQIRGKGAILSTLWVYNSIIEQSFTAISLSLYDNPQWENEVDTHEEAKELVDGLLHGYWLRDKSYHIAYKIKKLRQRIAEALEQTAPTIPNPTKKELAQL